MVSFLLHEKVECFFQALKFTPWVGVLDGLCILHFYWSWRRSKQQTGWKIDYWFANLFFLSFLNTCLFYPFSASIYNIPATLGHYEQIIEHIDHAFLINLLGYLCIWIGRYFFDYSGNFLGKWCALLNPLAILMERNIKNKKAVFSFALVAGCFGVWLFLMQFKTGAFFDLRSYFLQEDYLRPFFNVSITLLAMALSVLSLRYLQYRENKSLYAFFLLFFFSLFLGIRGTAISSLLFFLLQGIYRNQGNCHWKKIVCYSIGLSVLGIVLAHLRQNEPLSSGILVEWCLNLFYGNNFSDVRDFAWLLSAWDGEYFYGKSYISAFLSFIPRIFSETRQEWGFSAITNAWVGFDLEKMPGLRPGLFGEFYFNFGIIGVMIFGGLVGYTLRLADLKIKEAILVHKDLIRGIAQTVAFTCLIHLGCSASFWSLYLFLIFHLLLYCVRSVHWNVYTKHPKFGQTESCLAKAKKDS